MVGRRYFYYMLLLNALVNVMNFVPRILIEHRYDGAVSSILIAIPVGITFILLFQKVMSKFPGKGLPEIIEFMPGWMRNTILIYHAVIWYFAGLITLLAFSDITHTFINPNMQDYVVLSLFLSVVCLAARLPGASILFALEIVLLIDLPFSYLFTQRSFFNELISYDSIADALTYVGRWPEYAAIAAATFIFTGYTNLAIFNRNIEPLRPKEKKRKVWIIAGLASVSSFILFMSYLVPIGFQGMGGAGRHVYVWLSTADSIRIEYFFIERVVYVFLLIYIGVSLMSSIIHWHVAVEMVESMMQVKNRKKTSWITVGVFAVTSLGVQRYMEEADAFGLGKVYLNVRLVSEILMIGLVYFVSKRKERVKEEEGAVS